MNTTELLAELKAYVTPGATSTSSADDAFLQACLETARGLVDSYAGVRYEPAGYEPVTVEAVVSGPPGSTAVFTFTREDDIVRVVAVCQSSVPLGPSNTKVVVPEGFRSTMGFWSTEAWHHDNSTNAVGASPARPTLGETVGDEVTRTIAWETVDELEPTGTERFSTVPDSVLDRAYIEVASELFNRRTAPNGISQFSSPDGPPIRVARDPMVAAYPLLQPYVPLGFG